VITGEGELEFQDYFVRRQCLPKVEGFVFKGVQTSQPAPGVLKAIGEAQLVVFCPSNPWVSIDPILSVPGVRSALKSHLDQGNAVIAVSPIIGGQAVKGPAAKMYAELGVQPSAMAVARHYGASREDGLLSGFVLDRIDGDQETDITDLGIRTLLTETIMRTAEDRIRLAYEILQFGNSFG
jgi:LPPG:FO 2-phospho-L-lactate transferase